jgi:hypothetical protein
VADNLALLEKAIHGPQREQLTSSVTKLLQSGSIDLKRWVLGVDHSSDRAGLLLAHDLEIALEMVKAQDENRERFKELVLFTATEEFFTLRSRLGIGIDS